MTLLEKECVWDYPRPAVCEAFSGTLLVKHNNVTLAKTLRGFRTLETSHPPTYYIPLHDVVMDNLVENKHRTYCEWKGKASYFDLRLGDGNITNVAWTYRNPTTAFTAITDHISFYASKVDTCYVNDERVSAQEGDFYGGWITSNLEGPFKGGPDTLGW